MHPTVRKFHLRTCLLVWLSLGMIRSEAQVTLQTGLNFTASTYGVTSSALPPDPNGAMGPNRFVEFINGEFVVFNPTNIAHPIRTVDVDFWSAAGVNLSSSSAVTDPRVIYDPLSQRWFASMVDFNANATDPTVFANDFLFAVSATSNPSGTWHGFRFLADPDNGYFADFPTMGVDSNAVYISGNMFSGQDNPPLASSLVSIPKSDLLLATPTIANRTWHGDLDFSFAGMALQPATCFDGSSSGNILAIGDFGLDSSFHSNLVNFSVLNAATASASLSGSTNLIVTPYMVPDNADQGVPLFTPMQPDGTTTLAGNDARICARVYCVNGIIYAVHNTEVDGRMAICWYRVNAATHSLIESGVITNPELDLFFPCIAANASGTIVIGCNGCGPGATEFVSIYAIGGQTVNGVTTFGSPVLLQAGVTSYHGDDEVYDQLLDMPPLSRWGDYSTISADPSNPAGFWVIAMYPSDEANNDVWSTQVIQVLTSQAAVSLSISPSGTNMMLAWPVMASGFQLQAATNLTPAINWSNVTLTVLTNLTQNYVLAPVTKGNQYFRLFHP